jgi:hypothetical protein
MINAAERLALRKQSSEVQPARSTSHRPYSPAYSLFSTPATFAERLQVRVDPRVNRRNSAWGRRWIRWAALAFWRLEQSSFCRHSGHRLLGGFGTVSDTPKPTDPKQRVTEFRTPRDGRRRTVRAIGNELRVLYTAFLQDRLPPKIAELLRRLNSGRKR